MCNRSDPKSQCDPYRMTMIPPLYVQTPNDRRGCRRSSSRHQGEVFFLPDEKRDHCFFPAPGLIQGGCVLPRGSTLEREISGVDLSPGDWMPCDRIVGPIQAVHPNGKMCYGQGPREWAGRLGCLSKTTCSDSFPTLILPNHPEAPYGTAYGVCPLHPNQENTGGPSPSRVVEMNSLLYGGGHSLAPISNADSVKVTSPSPCLSGHHLSPIRMTTQNANPSLYQSCDIFTNYY